MSPLFGLTLPIGARGFLLNAVFRHFFIQYSHINIKSIDILKL